MLWSDTEPPTWFPMAIRTDEGWIDPKTREILVALSYPSDQVTVNLMGCAKIIRVHKRRRRIRGRCRIACPIPFDTGINPSWS